mmetsp:Transcript_9690/g.16811  ORF Transcript_9690/g.16811 Transcript_9690/m.16811 type:complete len:178 (+) Transcript_9690:71-604(+)|eukprot:CAMPEP_0196662260 /NCGR_PEP_ID=MMETSP1086-20130531/47887_1 /TAXON_ID=77921 /ORGANISM="Cyanoptyche  gloeocystis , Strain SAG4.97" /LENGTH=177 /DNA_ID=CAMNT_0041997535 /DNA_START=59 /DNA_END=592 /DNA_ORIENTATION=+
MYEDALLIIAVSIGSALFAEGISWLLIYRTDRYKKLKAEIDKTNKKLERKKEATNIISKQKQKDRKIDRYEESLKNANRDMSMWKMKSMFGVGLTFVLLYYALNTIYDAKVVAKLPFEPFPIFRFLTHRNLIGNDYTDCSMAFLFSLCSLSVRNHIQKMFGFAPRTPGGIFGSLKTK